MSKMIYNFLTRVVLCLGGGGVFLTFSAIIFSGFILAFILSLCKVGYGLKNRSWFFCLSLGVLFLEYAFLSISNEKELALLSLALTAFLAIPIILIPRKAPKINDKQRNLARLIDEQVRCARKQTPVEVQSLKCEKQQPLNCEVERFELDFQHVKSVISRLEFYPLSAPDKKIVRDLESAILTAEQGEFSPLIKSRINDGLGALLKIMSKYGV